MLYVEESRDVNFRPGASCTISDVVSARAIAALLLQFLAED